VSAPANEPASRADEEAAAVAPPAYLGSTPTVAGVLALQRSAGNAAACALVQRHSGQAVLARAPDPVLPGFSQGEYDSCGAASLVTALMIWDRQHPSTPNDLLVKACNLVLGKMDTSRSALVAKFAGMKADGAKIYDAAHSAITNVRDTAAAGGKITADEYKVLGLAIYRVYQTGAGLSTSEIEAIHQSLGLATGKSESADTLGGIFDTTVVSGLTPGQIAQAGWLRRSGGGVVPHAFLIGRLEDGTWFLSDQGEDPAVELQAPDVNVLRASTLQAAGGQGRSHLHTGAKPAILPAPWTGAKLLAGREGVRKKAATVVKPGTFLAEVDAGSFTTGERLVAWDFLGTFDSISSAHTGYLGSGSGHGALVVELPQGVFNLYKTNPVSDANVSETSIDVSDSKDGLLAGPHIYFHAWLMLGTKLGRKMSAFQIW